MARHDVELGRWIERARGRSGYELSPAQMRVRVYLLEHRGSTAGQVAAGTEMPPATVYRLAEEMLRHGFLVTVDNRLYPTRRGGRRG